MRPYCAPLALAALMMMPAPGTAAANPELDLSWKDGISVLSSDGDFSLKIGGRIMADTVSWDTDSAVEAAIGEQTSASEFRRARLYMAGTIYGNVIFKAQYDFAGGDADFKDVYLGIKGIPGLGTVRVGHFKEPFSLEALTSSKYITFMERALPGVFAPLRNTGLGFHSTALDNRLTMAAGVFHDSDGFGDSGGDNINFSARATGGGSDADLSGWYAYASWFVTGESRAYKDGKGVFSRVHPADNFTTDGGSGALELAVRVSNLDLNDTGAGINGGELDDLTVGANWYLNPSTRVMLNWVTADISGGLLGDADADADAVQARFQVDF